MTLTLPTTTKDTLEAIKTGEGLLDEHELMLRWHYDPDDPKAVASFRRQMWKLRTGRHYTGATITAIPVSGNRRLYRATDVADLENALANYDDKYAIGDSG